MEKFKITLKESKQIHSMAKNMSKFLTEVKMIPNKIITFESDEKNKESEINTYEIVGIKNKKGSKCFNWKIYFNLSKKDVKGRFHRHMLLNDSIDFQVENNTHLCLLLNNYNKPIVKKVKKEKVKEIKPEIKETV